MLWTSYTNHPLHAKSACEQVTYSVSMVQGWKGGELQGLAQLSHVVRLMGNRASSLFKHGAPPYCYSNVLKSRDTLDARLLKQMKWDWTSL